MQIKVPIGDWSDDGHGKCEHLFIESSLPVEELQQAYMESCKLTGLQFNNNTDYTGLTLSWMDPEYKDRHIAVEYESNQISRLAEDILIKHGLDFREDYEYYKEHPEEVLTIDGPDHFLTILMDFISLSLPEDFQWERIKDTTPVLNGYWNPHLNTQFGYGLFS